MKTYLLKDKFTEVQFYDDLSHLLNDDDHKVLIIDKQLVDLYKGIFEPLQTQFPVFTISGSEKSKDLSSLTAIYSFFQQNNVNRSTVVYGIGGGIVTDISAFAASTYMRGCRLKLVPTTLLAMVDAAIGGKTAINFQNTKNNIGTFFAAEEILIILDFLNTLPQKERLNGIAECVKISLVKPTEIYDLICLSKGNIGKEIIEKAIDLKFSICTLDPEDKKERRVLNLGHTFGHLIESLTDFSISHGEAVALGIRAAAILSLQEGMINQTDFDKIILILDHFEFPARLNIPLGEFDIERIGKLLLRDKKGTYKNNKVEINLVVFSEFQHAVVKVFPLQKIYQTLLKVIDQ